jgi:hypothetical protein
MRQGSTQNASEEDSTKTAQARKEVRDWIRSCMENGEVSKEPELQQESKLHYKPKNKEWGGIGEVKQPSRSKDKSQQLRGKQTDDVERDDFFGDDDYYDNQQ